MDTVTATLIMNSALIAQENSKSSWGARMSFDKSIQSGKSHRKPYRGAKAIDATCRNHGSCKWCEENRTHKNDKRELAAEQELREYNE